MSDKRPPRSFFETLTGQWQRYTHNSAGLDEQQAFKTNREVYLVNGDRCSVGDYVVVQDPENPAGTFVGQVNEVLQQRGSLADTSDQPDGVLVRKTKLTRQALPYRMPYIDLINEWVFVKFKVSGGPNFVHLPADPVSDSPLHSQCSTRLFHAQMYGLGHAVCLSRAFPDRPNPSNHLACQSQSEDSQHSANARCHPFTSISNQSPHPGRAPDHCS